MKIFSPELKTAVRDYRKPFFWAFLVLLLLLITVLLLRFLIPSGQTESAYPEKLEYVYFGRTVEYARDDVRKDGILLVNLREIAVSCGMHISGSEKCLRFSTDAGDIVELTDMENSVSVNGIHLSMERYAEFRGTDVFVPLSFVQSYFQGITCTEDAGTITISDASEETGSSAGIFLLYHGDEPAKQVSSDGIPLTVSEDAVNLNYVFQSDVSAFLPYLNPRDDRVYLSLRSPASPGTETDVPANLTEIHRLAKGVGTKYRLDMNAERALQALLAEMDAAGVTGVNAVRGYVDYKSQKANHDSRTYTERYYYKNHPESEGTYFSELAYAVLGQSYLNTVYISQGKYSLSAQDAQKVAQRAALAPGTSDHQTGLGVDLSLSNSADASFRETEAYQWLRKNAYKFGYIERYPQEAESRTGVAPEPYHWRFIGQTHAALMHEEGLICLEDYLKYLGRN